MDLDDFEAVLGRLGVDLWTLIETAVSLAARDHGRELRSRRDGIVELLYATPAAPPCQNCDPEDGPARTSVEKPAERGRVHEERDQPAKEDRNDGASPPIAQSLGEEEEEEEEEEDEEEEHKEEDDRDRRRYRRPVEDEQSRILAIKELLDYPDQSDDSLIHMLQTLADMDITFEALKETDIGRHVNNLRKHTCNEIRRLVKLLLRKWKELVDEWVKSTNPPEETATASMITDGDSPQQIQAKISQNRNQVPDFGYSPNIHSVHQTSDMNEKNGGSGSDKANNREGEAKAKAAPPIRKEAPVKPRPHPRPPSPAPPAKPEQKDTLLDPERLASARRRLHENYQEAHNAKKQRTIQVMDIHDIPRPKNSFLRADHRGVPGQAMVKRRG